MGKIIVVRHGNTEFNKARIFQPHHAPLSELGVEQAKRLGERLKDLKIVKVLTSDLLRTKQTMDLVLSKRLDSGPVQVIESDILREREFGDLKGIKFDDIAEDLFHPKSDFQPKNGESWDMFHDRVTKAWDFVLKHAKESLKSSEDVLLVVTHGLVKTSLASRIWKIKDPAKLSFENTSVSTVSAKKPHQVYEVNCTAHLEDDKLTMNPVGKAKL
jgi:broad specificity phosphatase PhoE